jgi:hypothetical protein
MDSTDRAAEILNELQAEFSRLPPPQGPEPGEYESEALYRAFLAHRLLMQLGAEAPTLELGQSRFAQLGSLPESKPTPIAALTSNTLAPEHNVVPEASRTSSLLFAPAQVISDPSFEDTLYAHPWGFRCRNRLVKANSSLAREGVNFLAANDTPRTVPNPSVYQDVYVGFDGVYHIDFGIYLRCNDPVPADRRIILAIWHYTPQAGGWNLRGKTPPMSITNRWQLYNLQVQSGGRYHRCEVYWHDDHPSDMNFDAAYCFVQRE